MAYLDNTLIYSDNFNKHQQYIILVLNTFVIVSLHLKFDKCEFYFKDVKHLGLVITMEGIKIDYKNICTVQH
jgi:hypothetical protein